MLFPPNSPIKSILFENLEGRGGKTLKRGNDEEKELRNLD